MQNLMCMRKKAKRNNFIGAWARPTCWSGRASSRAGAVVLTQGVCTRGLLFRELMVSWKLAGGASAPIAGPTQYPVHLCRTIWGQTTTSGDTVLPSADRLPEDFLSLWSLYTHIYTRPFPPGAKSQVHPPGDRQQTQENHNPTVQQRCPETSWTLAFPTSRTRWALGHLSPCPPVSGATPPPEVWHQLRDPWAL